MRKFIVIKTEKTFRKLFVDEILYCKANGVYTKVYLKNMDNPFIASKMLKEFEEILANNNFFRISRYYLVNLDHCQQISSNGTMEIVLFTNKKLQVSRSRFKLLVENFCAYS